MTIWLYLTSAGDSAVLLPLIAWITVWLFAPAGTRRDGWRWLVAVAVCGGIVTGSKLLFMGWHIGLPGLDYTGFSGHSAMSALVWPTVAALLASRGNVTTRTIAIGLGVLLALCVALSRVLLRVHSVSEVILGCSLGLATAGWFLMASPVAQRASLRAVLLLAVVALLFIPPLYGRMFPSQHLLRKVALTLSGHEHIFHRAISLR